MNLKIIPLRQVVFLALILLLISLRLGIWKLFPAMEFSIKDEFSNMIIAGTIFGLAMVFYGIKFIRAEAWVKTGVEGPLALLITAAVASVAWTADLSATVSAITMLVAYALFFHMLFEVLAADAMSRQVFLWFFVVASVVVSLVGINDIIYLSHVSPADVESARLTNESLWYILTHKRACSLFGWPNVLAGFLMLGMPLVVGFFFVARHWLWKTACVLSGAVMLTAFFYTFSFLGWSVFLIASILMGVFFWRSGFLKIPPLLGRLLVAGAVLMMVLFTLVVMKKDFVESITPRQRYVQVVASVIAQHPLRGVGFGAYRAASFKFVTDKHGLTGFAHNTYFQIWAEVGLAGFIAIVWMLCVLGRLFFRSWAMVQAYDHRIMLLVVAGGMLAFLTDNLNSFTMLKPNSSFFFWTWLAVVCSFIHPARKFNSRWIMVALMLVCVVGIFPVWRTGCYLYWLQQGVQRVNAGQVKEGRAALRHAQSFDPIDVRVWMTLGTTYVREFQLTQQKDLVEKAQLSFEQAVVLAPNLYYNYLIFSRIHAFKGDMTQAAALEHKAMAVSPYETRRDLLLFQGGQK